jgi:hypothetical protein
VLEFANGRYFDGTTNSTVLSTLVANSPTVTPGVGMVCDGTNFATLSALLDGIKTAGGATIVVEADGGDNSTATGLMGFTSGNPDSPFIANGSGTTATMNCWNGTNMAGPVAVDVSKRYPYAAAWNNTGIIKSATLANVATNSQNFTNPITGAVLGSWNGGFAWGGHIRSIAVYPVVVSDGYLAQMSWPSKFSRPYDGVAALAISGGWVGCGSTLASYFKTGAAWTMFYNGVLSSSSSGQLCVLFTNVHEGATPPWYGTEVYVHDSGIIRVQIMSGWDGSSLTNLIRVEGSTKVYDDQGHTITVARDDSNLAAGIEILVDGVPETLTVAADNITGPIDTTLGEFEIAGQFGGFSNVRMDTMIMSSTKRPHSYTTDAIAAGRRPAADADTLGYYDFREGTGTTTADKSGNGNTGTIHSGTWI